MIRQKANYLLRSIANFRQEKRCPFCGSTSLEKVDSKYFFTSLLKCNNCKLEHRHPKDDKEWLNRYYQKEYAIKTHLMTTLPSDEEIEKMKAENFPSQRSYKQYLDALSGGKKGIKVIDYGCSWGYNVFKLKQEGCDVVGFEISVPRAEFGMKKLGVKIYSDTAKLPLENDIVLSSHVIEHLDSIQDFIDVSKRILKKDGLFMAFCPNGSEAYKNREPYIWHINWGGVHPNSLSLDFAKHAFRDNPYLIMTGDWVFDAGQMAAWDQRSQVTGSYQAGKELLIIAKPNIKL